jgi:formylglycine-generating enzyme required for sulfatase activity
MTITIDREQLTVQGFSEDLSNHVGLDMVVVLGGSFQMGSPDTELDRVKREGPQRQVTVPTFLMGQYPVTNAQWNEIVTTTKGKRDLQAKKEGNQLPVVWVSWLDAQEFCTRLQQATGRPYRLPSESEWEYACRAGSTTPYAYGETLTPELANYNWEQTYGDFGVVKQKKLSKPSEVGKFPANAWGLYDMHGNVWEWCADDWHSSYEGIPIDGSIRRFKNSETTSRKVIRGGSWLGYPEDSRSAFRTFHDEDRAFDGLGFRLVCPFHRTL